MVDLGTFGGVNSRPNAMNDSGQVVGVADPLTGFQGRPFSWTATGGMVDISPGGGADINNSGQIVGGEFLRTAVGGSVDLGTLGGTNGTSANAINDSGQVVGSSYTSGNAALHAFSWTAKGGMVDLGTLGGTSSTAVAVNDSGQVVGYSYTIGKPVASLPRSAAERLRRVIVPLQTRSCSLFSSLSLTWKPGALFGSVALRIRATAYSASAFDAAAELGSTNPRILGRSGGHPSQRGVEDVEDIRARQPIFRGITCFHPEPRPYRRGFLWGL